MGQTGKTEEALLYFTVAGGRFAVPTSEVEHIVSLQKSDLSPIPFGTNDRLRGLFRFRGAIFPLAGIRESSWQIEEEDQLTVLLLNDKGKEFGISVDSVRNLDAKTESGNVVLVRACELYDGSYESE